MSPRDALGFWVPVRGVIPSAPLAPAAQRGARVAKAKAAKATKAGATSMLLWVLAGVLLVKAMR